MKIPGKMRDIYDEIAEIITQYSDRYLDDEYRAICLRLLGKLCCKRPSPLLKGRRNTWAAGIVYAVASNNYIFDKSIPIHMTAEDLVRPFGLAPSTAANKACEIRKMVSMTPWDTQWQLRALIERNPAIWMLSLNGYVVDVRNLPLEVQQEAVRRGLIPYLPTAKQETEQQREKPAEQAPKEDTPSEPAPPADFSDIYDRFGAE